MHFKPGICCAVFVSIACVFCPAVSIAQEEETGWRFGVIPRLWVSAITLPDEDNVSNGTVLVPLFGGTVSISPGFAPNVSLLASGFYGTGDGDGVFTDTGADGNLDIKRTDLEVLFRYSFPGTGINLNVGARYVELISKFKTNSGSFNNRDETDLWLGEIGLGFVRDITEDGRHRMFGNLIGSFGNGKNDFKDSQGFKSDDSALAVGADVNIGYQWWVTSFANIGLRYRSFAILTENDFDLTKLVSVHGPEVSIGIVF